MVYTQFLHSNEIEQAANLLKMGELVAFPTETVYGLGAKLFDPEAIFAIFKVKGRPSDNPLIAHISSLAQVEELADQIPEIFYTLANQFFPGPLAIVLKRRQNVPGIVSAGLDSIAIRMPSHPIALKLIELVGQPLVAPSANLSGKPSSTQAKHVMEDFSGKIAAVIDGGKTEVGIESTVISLLGKKPILLRPGAIRKEQIEEVLGYFLESVSISHGESALSPGMKYRHYAPIAPIKIFQTIESLKDYLVGRLSSGPTMILWNKFHKLPFPGLEPFILSTKEFYSLLRLADKKQYHEILVLCDEDLQADAALMNRLTKAAGII